MSHIEQFQHLKIHLEDIQSATNNFSDDHFIGHGGFGKVYKGEIFHSTGKIMVALKRLDRAFGQGDSEFWKEIMMLSFYKHKNIVSLLGYCDDFGEKILVYEYASNKSLDSYLANSNLTWGKRLKICVGAARGLAYLHTPAETQLRIFHRDIKSSNILLDHRWNAKISDFGLSKFAPVNDHFTYVVSNPVGTPWYIDPLYHETGLLTKESDVYSFGVVLFEVLCGRLCYGTQSLRPLTVLVREYYEKNKISELIYSNIKDEINISSLKLFVDIAYQCLKRKREDRPLMTQIVSALERAYCFQEKAELVHEAGILKVKVLGTTNIRSKKPFDASNHYFILYIGRYGPLYVKSTSNYNVVTAEWNEEFTLYVENFHVQCLFIHVNKVISVSKHRQLGEAKMKLTDLTPEVPRTCNLNVIGNEIRNIGDLRVEVLYKALPDDHLEDVITSVQNTPIGKPMFGGLLVVIIHSARLYHTKHQHSSVSLFYRGQLRKTQTILNTNKPIWLQEFTFRLEGPPTEEKLHLEVVDKSWMGLIPRMGSLGCINIGLADVVDKKRINTLYVLEPGYLVNGHYKYNLLQVELHWKTSY